MTIPVALEGLRAALAERGGTAYLLTVSDDGGPHAVSRPLRWEADALAADVGTRTAANAGSPGPRCRCSVRCAARATTA